MYLYHNFLIHLSADGQLGCFHVLAIINRAVMNIGVHVSLSILVSSICPAVGLPGHMASSSTNVLRNLHTVLHSGSINLHSHQHCKIILFSPHPHQHLLFVDFFDDGHFDHCVMISYWSFDLHFSNNDRCLTSFKVFISYLYIFFGEMSV